VRLVYLRKFFQEGETEWNNLIAKWNEFIRAIGTERVNFRKKVSDGRGGYYKWNTVEFDGKKKFATEENDPLWDKKLPNMFHEEDYKISKWDGNEILLPKNSDPVVMELFVNSRDPIYKQVTHSMPQEMDIQFDIGLMEKGINNIGQEYVAQSPIFGSRPTADSIAVQFPNELFTLAFFNPNQVKSAMNANGVFSKESDNIYK